MERESPDGNAKFQWRRPSGVCCGGKPGVEGWWAKGAVFGRWMASALPMTTTMWLKRGFSGCSGIDVELGRLGKVT